MSAALAIIFEDSMPFAANDNMRLHVVHDARGNVTTDGRYNFSYDSSDQPIFLSGDASGNFRYDGHMKRVKQDINGEVIYSVYSRSGHILYRDNATTNTFTDYIRFNGVTLARVFGGRGLAEQIFCLHQDHLGNPVLATDVNGDVMWRESYSPFGESLIGPAANDNDENFTGHIKDADTGSVYMQARYYDPVVPRFLSIDPVGFIGSGMNLGMFNRYSYTMNDPINLIDPDGRACTKTTGSNICNRNYKTKIKSGRQAEKAERNHLRTNDKERVTSGRVSASYTKDDSYKRGREYDIVSQTKDGHYNLTEVKYRKTKDTKVKSGVKPLEGGKLGWRAYQGLVTARQASFDLNAAGEDITLSGKGIPGGEITLSPDQYTITWVLANQHGKAIGANINDGSGGIQEVLDNFVTPD